MRELGVYKSTKRDHYYLVDSLENVHDPVKLVGNFCNLQDLMDQDYTVLLTVYTSSNGYQMLHIKQSQLTMRMN